MTDHQTVWRRSNEELNPKSLCSIVKHGGGSVLVSGCFNYQSVDKLHFITGVTNKIMYLDILKNNLK